MTKHARECSLEGRHKLKLFICTEKNVKLFFNCVRCLVGAEFFGGPYTLTDKFSSAQRVQVFMSTYLDSFTTFYIEVNMLNIVCLAAGVSGPAERGRIC